jgi:CubicO group peptidase (beta-lactamase class C family)
MNKVILLFLALSLRFSEIKAQNYYQLETQLDKIQREFSIPGVSIAVVKGNKIVYEFNSGLLNINKQDTVSNETVYPIASATKTFTAMGIGILLDQGKLSLQDPIVKFLPWFKLSDEYVTKNLTIRDLLSHRSGLSSEGLIYMGSGFDRSETVKRLKDMPISNFRSSFAYSNILYNALGLIIEEVSGLSWEEFIQINVLDALDMQNSTSDFERRKTSNTVIPHRFIDYENGQIKPASESFPLSNGPAGGIRSTTSDMSKYIKLLLNKGIMNSETIVQPSTIQELWEPHIRSWDYWTREGSFSAYGLGWFLTDYAAKRIMFHPGGGGGVTSLISLMPSEDIGVIVLTNLDSWSVFAFTNTIYDHFLKLELYDWIEIIRPQEENPKELAKWVSEFENSLIRSTSPTINLVKYCGTFQHKTFGDVTIELVNDKLILKRGGYISDLNHWHYDTFKSIIRNNKMGFDTVTFYIGPDGTVTKMMIWDIKEFFKVRETSSEANHH